LKQIAFADDEYVILLNDDTIVSRDFIDELVSPLLNEQKTIISVPKILYASNINKIWYAGGNVNLWKGIISHVGIRDFDSPKYSFKNETDYATGCCFCIKYSDLKKLNYFDLSFDMYCEDVDLSLRAKALNRTIIYNPKSVILHRVSQSIGEHSFKKNKLKLQSQLRLFWKHATGVQLLSISLYWILIHLPYQFVRWLYLRNK
jgi:GT2 family glycosyltransferase